jgi:3-hydroxypropionyl-CoA synthetase (ADP-forming)
MVLSKKTIQKAEQIFDFAISEKRHMLYEHEVYNLLNLLDVDTPAFAFVKDASQVNDKVLDNFGKEIMVKVVSKDIAHKQKVGGVKKIKTHDSMFVKYVVDSMKAEVLSHYEKEKPLIDGFLLIEAVDFKQSLGYEILMGISMDRDFGPVLTLSKGGDDAEFFAKYYDPANISLPLHDKAMADKMAKGINISRKFEKIGHAEYVDMMANGIYAMSRLAYVFSVLGETRYNLTTMDVNPFVITKDHRFMAIDGYAEFEAHDSKPIRGVNTENMDSVFKPKGIAILGVSTDSSKQSLANEILHLIMDFNRDDIYCINPKGGTAVFGGKEFTLYKSFEELPTSVEMAVYAAPAKYIPSFFSDLGKKIPKSVIMIPGMPSGLKYKDFAKQLDEVVPKGVRIVGPNCMGVFYAPDEQAWGVNTLFLDEERLKIKYGKHSNVTMLTQSGGIAVTLVDRFAHTPIFKSIVSFGNKYDINLTDLLSYFETQVNTKVIAMYLEGFEPLEGRMFFELAKHSSKPLILYKGGRTEEGAKAAMSHTAAMTGNYEVFEAACKQSGVMLIEDVETYSEVVKGFSLLAEKRFTGNNVAAITNAGFEATIFSDEIGDMTIATLSEQTLKRLDKANTHKLAAVSSAILDVTPMSDDYMYGQFIEALLQDDGVDCLMISAVPHVESLKAAPSNCHDEDGLANIIIRLYEKYDKPIVVSINAGDYYDEFVSIMEKAGIAVYDNVKSAARVLDKVTGWHCRK